MGATGLKKFLSNFPNDAKNWSLATEEIRDIARTSKEFINDLENKSIQPLDFRSLRTPSDWNTKGKAYILKVYEKMKPNTRKEFDKYLKNHFNIN
jgi:hypothetical protein